MRILVVDDEPAVLAALDRALRLEGYEVELAGDGEEALRAVSAFHPDAIVLDVLMPRVDGLEVCRRLRGVGDRTPVLVLTARDAVSARVAGLDAGADDYLAKPFALEELLARLRALLRRTVLPGVAGDRPAAGAGGAGAGGGGAEAGGGGAEAGGGGSGDETLDVAGLELDPVSYQAWRDGRLLELTRTEMALLELFLRHPNQVLTRSVILDRVWGYDFGPSSNSLEVYVGYLRRKTEAGGEPRLIQTVRGVGYVLRRPADPTPGVGRRAGGPGGNGGREPAGPGGSAGGR